MDNTLDFKRQQVMKMLQAEVSKYTNDGSTLPQAISLVCKNLGLNPYDITDKYFPEVKSEDLNGYKDIKANEGSFVTLKGDSSQNQYEVININNKDAIVLRNTDNNEEIVASEDEITPVITENKMDNLNEAQYSVSINGLETTDAAALSQMLSSAAQAEQSNGAVTDPMNITPEPMDMATGMPMDMGAGLPEPSLDMPMDSTMPEETLPAEDSIEDVPAVEDDIEFDEELPEGEPISLATDANAYANPEMDTAVVPTDSLEDAGFEEPTEDEATPVENPEELEPANDFGGEESIEDMSMDDMMDDGMYEGFDYDALIKEAMEAAGINEAEETIPESEDVEELDESEDDGSMKGEQEEYAEEITEGNAEINAGDNINLDEDTSFDDEIAEALRLAGVELNESEEEIEESEELTEGNAEINAGDNINLDDDSDESFDDEIAEALRLAGVELAEAEATMPTPVDEKTLYANKEAEKNEDLAPEYHEVDTTPFSKESSEGFKMTLESAVKVDRVKKIYETAKSMYAKKDIADWMTLDRRYITKLIKEGVGYEKANKILTAAKKGK